MTIKQFIEKAIEGGFDNLPFLMVKKPLKVGYEGSIIFAENDVEGWKSRETMHIDEIIKNPHKILLDPLAWQAVGKVEGVDGALQMDSKYGFRLPVWKDQMHRMVDALAEGKSIEQFLETI